jgi:hypothetical protein
VRAGEQGTAHAAPAVARQHGHAELGVAVAACDVRRADQAQLVVVYAECCVALEIDARDVGAHRCVVERCTETQPPVFTAEGEKMGLERELLQPGKFANVNIHSWRSVGQVLPCKV